MEDRISSLESFAQMSATIARIMNEHMDTMGERQRQSEEWQRQSEEWQRRVEIRQQQVEIRHRQAEEWQRRAEASQRQRDELLQQLLQTVAVMQADIVRIDETHS